MKPGIITTRQIITGSTLLLLTCIILLSAGKTAAFSETILIIVALVIALLIVMIIPTVVNRRLRRGNSKEEANTILARDTTLSGDTVSTLLEQINDAFIALDAELVCTFMNTKARRIFGFGPEENVYKPLGGLFPGFEGENFRRLCLDARQRNQYLQAEAYFPSLRKWLQQHIHPFAAGVTVFFCDITGQKEAEKKIVKLNRLYLFISQLNQMIARTEEETLLLREACKIAVTAGGYKMAWIGRYDESGNTFLPLMPQDAAADYTATALKLSAADHPGGSGPSGTAFQTGALQVWNDLQAQPAGSSLDALFLENNYLSAVALPIVKSAKTVAIFNLYAETKDFFDDDEVAHLKETTNDISFALDLFEEEALRKKAENAVLESERRYQMLTEISPVGIFHTDPTGYTTYVNPRWCQISGLSREEALGDGWLRAVDEADRQSLAKGWREATSAHDISVSEYRFVRPDGTVSWVIGQATPEWGADNQLAGYVGTITDITTRKNGEFELKSANERFETIAKATNDVIWDWNLLTDELWWNDNYYNLFGYDRKSQRPNIVSWNSRIHPEDCRRVIEGIRRAIDAGESHWYDEYRYLQSDGNTVYIYDRGFILRDDKGQPYRMMGSMLDVTPLKVAREELIKEKNLSDSIINSLPGIFYLFSYEGKYIRWNKNLETVSHYSSDEIRAIHPLDFFDDADKVLVREKIAATFDTGEVTVQANLTGKTGVKTPYYFTGVPIEYEGKRCLMGVGIDFSERLKAQEEAEQASRQLRQLAVHLQTIREEERKRIGREIHDELGQQLTAIKMDIAWINKKIPEDMVPLKGKLSNVIQLLDGSNQSIRRILSELRPGVLDDHGLLDAIQWLGKQFTATTDIPVAFTSTESEIRPALNVANCIFRVYQEAYTNITRYARATRVSSSLKLAGDRIVVSIEDDGVGFDAVSAQRGKSFGILGMKERVLSLDGAFELFSAPGQGTRIIIDLPFNQNLIH